MIDVTTSSMEAYSAYLRGSAIAEYKLLTVTEPTHMNRRFVHPVYHHRLARICDQSGMKAEATAEYGRFVKLWEKAEGQRPELQEARSRLQK